MKRAFLLALCAVPFVATATLRAADHIDSPATIAEPAADITDLYAWMSDDTEYLNLVQGVMPFAGGDAVFPTSVQYVFHVNSGATLGFGGGTETQILCQFYDVNAIECWGGDSYVVGDPSDPAGITSDDGKLRVFAGMRDDPFFFELNGFNTAVSTVVSAAGGLTFDADGCPTVDAGTSGVLVGMLQSGTDGAPASDTLAGANVLALVVQVATSEVNSGGDVLGVWASTHQTN